MNEKIKNSWDKIKPSEEAQMRMLTKILASAEERQKPKIRKAPLILAGAAMVFFFFAVNGNFVKPAGGMFSGSIEDDDLIIINEGYEEVSTSLDYAGFFYPISLNSFEENPIFLPLQYAGAVYLGLDAPGEFHQIELTFEAQEKSVEVFFSNVGKPIHCMSYYDLEKMKSSLISGYSVKIVHNGVKGGMDYYYLYCEHDGMYLEMVSTGLTQMEMTDTFRKLAVWLNEERIEQGINGIIYPAG